MDVSEYRGNDIMGPAYSEVIRVEGEEQGQIVVFSEPLIGGMLDWKRLGRHELLHILFMLSESDSDSSPPSWIVEGGCLWLESDRERDRLDLILRYSILEGGAKRETIRRLLMSEAVLGAATPQGQAIVGLVVYSCIERELGRKAVDDLLSRLLRGEEWKDAIHEVTGKGIAALLEWSEREYVEWISAECGGADLLTQAMAAANAGESASAIRMVSDIIEEYPESPFLPWVLRVKWDALAYWGKWEEARDCVEEFLGRFPHHLLTYEALVARVEIAAREGDVYGAHAEGNSLLGEILWAPWHAALIERVRRALKATEGTK